MEYVFTYNTIEVKKCHRRNPKDEKEPVGKRLLLQKQANTCERRCTINVLENTKSNRGNRLSQSACRRLAKKESKYRRRKVADDLYRNGATPS
jgi:hypothetical protein